MIDLYNKTCLECSSLITRRYSTSFSMGIRAFAQRFRAPIYAIYGFVRFADEIVDTFHQYPKADLLKKFEADTYSSIQQGISLNPVLQSFQQTVHQYKIETELIDAFLRSMEMDLHHSNYEDALYQSYIYGSAEVVGLMCLRVFCEGDDALYQKLRPAAQSLGAAFQKINFLRDMKSDFEERGRTYFPKVDFRQFSTEEKRAIEADIKADFDAAYKGICELPQGVRLGVYSAYVYYIALLKRIKRASVKTVKQERIRVPNRQKIYLLIGAALRNRIGWM